MSEQGSDKTIKNFDSKNKFKKIQNLKNRKLKIVERRVQLESALDNVSGLNRFKSKTRYVAPVFLSAPKCNFRSLINPTRKAEASAAAELAVLF